MATIYDVRNALLSLDIPVYHFVAPEIKNDKFVIWAETSAEYPLYADDEPQEARIRGQIYYYTVSEYDEIVSALTSALIENEVGFTISNIGRDFDLKMIVYQIDWEADCGSCEIY